MGTVTRNIKVSPIDRAIAAVLNSAYTLKGMTRNELSEKTGINATTMQRLLSGKSAWNSSQFLEVCLAIGGPKSPEALFREAIDFIPYLPKLPVSDGTGTTDDLDRKRRQREAAAMSIEELEQLGGAATRDAELDSDEPETT